ncbi:MAG: two-component system response regulator [Chlamydiae bacterium CG10_big_fil_rev_8_21_14_0_10_35_9]|nr:MAG: two-component system response regulator [Chlamydiae bacterium CG10_big_fil_rev_8_21_14_0_10_35_9]
MAIEKILVVDDEAILRSFLKDTLIRKGKIITTAEDGLEAINILKKSSFDLVITDLKMPHKTGLDVLNFIKKHDPKTTVVLMTAHASVETAVEAMQKGAFHYLIKPFSPDAIETILQKAEEQVALIEENEFLKEEMSSTSEFVAESSAMKNLIKDISKIAKSSASVFISGESGTGKEVIARVIHNLSKRKHKPFITVNCPAIPDTLIESEFFGHEKGAFTGALQKRVGRFERADSGTLLLDEVTEIPLLMQPKLLRAIQEQEFERIGGVNPIKVDVRFISTSNRDMAKAIATNAFRQDLYYRLNVVPIHILPLRERKADIVPLAEFFIKKIGNEQKKERKALTPSAVEKLTKYNWPGNVRELRNVIERALVLDDGVLIEPEHLFLENISTKEKSSNSLEGKPLKEIEKHYILHTLKAKQNNRSNTAKILGITERTLRNKLKSYGLKSCE